MYWSLLVILCWCLAALPAGLILGRRLRQASQPQHSRETSTS